MFENHDEPEKHPHGWIHPAARLLSGNWIAREQYGQWAIRRIGRDDWLEIMPNEFDQVKYYATEIDRDGVIVFYGTPKAKEWYWREKVSKPNKEGEDDEHDHGGV